MTRGTSCEARGRREASASSASSTTPAYAKDGGVHAREGLANDGQSEEETVSRPGAIDNVVHGEQREWHPENELQLEMHVVIEAVRREGEDAACDEARRRVARQRACEPTGGEARQDHAADKRDVVDEDWIDAYPEEWRQHQPGQRHRIRIGERIVRGEKDIGFEEMCRIASDRVRRPAQAPHAEVRIGVKRHRGIEMKGLGKSRDGRQADEEEQQACRSPGSGAWMSGARRNGVRAVVAADGPP
jgi:hypothetical protein